MGIGERPLEAVADLEPRAMLVRGDQEQQAVVLSLLAEPPFAEQRIGVGLDLLALEARDRGDDELRPGLVLEVLQPGAQGGAIVGAEHVGPVDDATGQLRQLVRRDLGGRRTGIAREEAETEKQAGRPRAAIGSSASSGSWAASRRWTGAIPLRT